MWTRCNPIFFLLFFLNSILYGAESLVVHLTTKPSLQPLYLSQLQGAPHRLNLCYAEEMRSLLAFDLMHNGFNSLVSAQSRYEERLQHRERRHRLDRTFWMQEQLSALVTLDLQGDHLTATLFHVAKGSTKNYRAIPLTQDPLIDRRAIHLLADSIQKELFGVEGIASTQILFSQRVQHDTSLGPDWLSDIWISDWDGANARRLTMGRGYCLSPGFLDGGYFYVSTDKGQSKIYRSAFQDAKGELWFKLSGNQLLPSLAKNQSQIAFISDTAGRADLFTLDLDRRGYPLGKPRQLFSAPYAAQASPTYHPDGMQLAFVSDKEGSPRIYVIDTTEKVRPSPRLLTQKNRENTSPAWSPDGTKLAYSARCDGVRQIWIYDFPTGQEWQLTAGHENKENPSWAPDSLHLVYNTETKDVSELFVINLTQRIPVQISSGFGQKRFASWGMRAERK